MDTPPPPVQMVQLLAGFQISQALYAAAKIGVADQLVDGPRSVDDLAATLQADPPSLRRLIRSLASLGVFTEVEQNVFALTPLGQTLVSDAPGSMRDLALMWMETHYSAFAGLTDTVRTGKCAATTHYGAPFFEWLSGQPEQVHRFSRAMANLTDGIKLSAVAGYDYGSPRKIVDVGGADGALLASVLDKVPTASGIVFDLPHVIDAATPTLKGYGLGERLVGESGDFFTQVPAGADAYLLSMILHDWNDESARKILANIASVAPSGARVHALEFVVPPGDAPHMAKMIDLTMLGMLDGRERAEPEFRELVESAGLRYDGAVQTPTPLSFVQATVL
jgi:hypothetical protein